MRIRRLLRPTLSKPMVVDICLALAIALPGLHVLAVRGHHGPAPIVAVLLDVALAVPLIWRRRAPVVVFAVIAAVALTQWILGHRLFADVALLVAFYTVAAYSSRRATIAAAAILEAGVLLATFTWAQLDRGPLGFVLLSGMVTASGFIGANMRTRRAYLAALEDRNARLEFERDQQAQLAAAAERARIAREMHDIVAHNLSVMVALADGASYTADADPARAARAMTQVSATGRQALTEMRRLLGVLHENQSPALQPQPGIGDLDQLLAPLRLTGLRGELIFEGPVAGLPPGLQLAVYRLVQEALTNTLKHAVDARTATVRLRFLEPTLEVEILDDGAPLQAASEAAAPGHGIAGMRERAAMYGGTVEAGPRPGRGWRVAAVFDLSAQGLSS